MIAEFLLRPFSRAAIAAAAMSIVALLAAPAAAQDTTRVEVYEFGIYARGDVVGETTPHNQGFRHLAVVNIEHLETTRTIPGRLGIAFGVRYRVYGNELGGPVPVKVIIRFPPQGLYNPEYPDPLQVDILERVETSGDDNFNIISFDKQWEIEPGIWTIEFWSGDAKLGEEAFEVIIPPVS